jgi:hypothetical protein
MQRLHGVASHFIAPTLWSPLGVKNHSDMYAFSVRYLR